MTHSNKLIYILVFIIIMFSNLSGFAISQQTQPPQPPLNLKEVRQLDSFIAQRLNLTSEQIKILRAKKSKNIKEMQNTVEKMEVLRKKIHNVYIIGIPKYQADLKTATMKVELAILKQNADRIRYENRKTFESILTDKQKAEFEILKKELAASRR